MQVCAIYEGKADCKELWVIIFERQSRVLLFAMSNAISYINLSPFYPVCYRYHHFSLTLCYGDKLIST